MKWKILNIELYIYSVCIRYFLKRKKFKTVEYFSNRKKKLAKAMRDNFKIIHSRHVNTIGYDHEHKICVIAYNHIHGGKNVYYYNVSQEQFEELKSTDDIAENAERILGKIEKEVLTG